MSENKKAVLYRMTIGKSVCPYGLKSKYLLEKKGYTVEDHTFDTREQTDAFKKEYQVDTTPQTFINGKRIGGYDDLRAYFNMPPAKPEGTTYKPVIAIFAVAFLMALAINWAVSYSISIVPTIEFFIAVSMCLLAVQKLRDLFAFTNQFLGYDLLARKWLPYAYIYPFAEAFAGIGMIAGILTLPVALTALFIGTIGAISVFKAVYIDKRELKCACVGGNSNVPLGFVSLTENLMMMAMAIWMLVNNI